MNFCGIFTGVLYVYGKHQHGDEASRAILASIDEVLNTLEPRDLHSELMMLSSVDTFFTIEGHDLNQSLNMFNSSDDQLSRLGIFLVIISGLIAVAIVYYICIQRNERRYIDSFEENCKAVSNSADLSENIGAETKEDNDAADKFIDDDLHFEPYRDGRQSIGVPF